MFLKVQLYIVSLFFLFALLFINKVPVCWSGEDCDFFWKHCDGIQQCIYKHFYAIVSFVMIIVGFIFFFRIRYILLGAGDLTERVENIEDQNFEHLTFLATYIIPLLTFDLDFHLEENRNGLMFFLVLVFIGFIYVKTNMYYTNPTLAVFGFRIYKADTYGVKKNVILITKGRISKDDSISCRHISDNVYLANIITKR
jgi:hypothetical protein